MTYWLLEAGALARVSYHAGELSLLASQQRIDLEELNDIKRALDDAFDDLRHNERERTEPN